MTLSVLHLRDGQRAGGKAKWKTNAAIRLDKHVGARVVEQPLDKRWGDEGHITGEKQHTTELRCAQGGDNATERTTAGNRITPNYPARQTHFIDQRTRMAKQSMAAEFQPGLLTPHAGTQATGKNTDLYLAGGDSHLKFRFAFRRIFAKFPVLFPRVPRNVRIETA